MENFINLKFIVKIRVLWKASFMSVTETNDEVATR